jgi:hypothetical protein
MPVGAMALDELGARALDETVARALDETVAHYAGHHRAEYPQGESRPPSDPEPSWKT